MIGASFDSTKTPLHDLLGRDESGKLQLPDFQRGWVWDDERIRSLLASVSVSFPIGAVMLLETGGSSVRFKPRRLAEKTVCVVSCQRSPEPVFLKWKGMEAVPGGDFFVRSGPGTVKLSPDSAWEYIRTRFAGSGLGE